MPGPENPLTQINSMKTNSKIFCALFFVLGLIAAYSAIFLGAEHQYFVACFTLNFSAILALDAKKQSNESNSD